MTTIYVDNIAPNLNSKVSAPNLIMPTGSVIQVKNAIKTDTQSINSQSPVDVTGLSVTITPSSTTSKLLIIGNLQHSAHGHAHVRLIRDTTPLALGDAAGGRTRGGAHYQGDSNYHQQYDTVTYAPNVLDEPATTSAITYKFQAWTAHHSTYYNYINRQKDDTDANWVTRVASQLTVMEIAG